MAAKTGFLAPEAARSRPPARPRHRRAAEADRAVRPRRAAVARTAPVGLSISAFHYRSVAHDSGGTRRSSVLEIAEALAELVEPLFGPSSTNGFFFDNMRQVGDVVLGVLLDQEVGQCPGFGVGVEACFRSRNRLSSRTSVSSESAGRDGQILSKLLQPRPVDRPDAAPALGAAEVGRLEVHRRCPR